jgi:hypothetical protein
MDLSTIVLLGLFLIIGYLLISRMMGSSMLGGQRGNMYPRYDDPDVDSRGSFGPSRGLRDTRRYDDPDVESRGSFGRSQGDSGFVRGDGGAGRVDNPDVESHGGFGRSK